MYSSDIFSNTSNSYSPLRLPTPSRLYYPTQTHKLWFGLVRLTPWRTNITSGGLHAPTRVSLEGEAHFIQLPIDFVAHHSWVVFFFSFCTALLSRMLEYARPRFAHCSSYAVNGSLTLLLCLSL